MNGTIIFTEEEEMDDEIMVITNTWTAMDACGNVTTAVQELSAIVNSDLSVSISAPSSIKCNSHNNLVEAIVEGGEGPFTYEWEIEGNECFIYGGQGTQTIDIYVGFQTVTVRVKVTDANACETTAEYEIICISKGSLDRSSEFDYDGEIFISSLAPNPTSDKIVFTVLSDESERIEYTLLNAMNEKIAIGQIDALQKENDITLNVSDYPSGIYYIRIDNGLSTDIKRFIKIK
jgi:hypothetical protein